MAWGGGILQLLPWFYQPLPVMPINADMSYMKNEDMLARLAQFQEKFPHVPCHWHHLAPGRRNFAMPQ